MIPFLLYGMVQLETGKVSARGMTTRLVLFHSSKYFGTLDQATAYTKTSEYQQSKT
jgi:hypothetical protein